MCFRVLARGSRLLCLWTSAQGAAAAAGSTGSRKRIPTERIILQVGDTSSICHSSISTASSHSALVVGSCSSTCGDLSSRKTQYLVSSHNSYDRSTISNTNHYTNGNRGSSTVSFRRGNSRTVDLMVPVLICVTSTTFYFSFYSSFQVFLLSHGFTNMRTLGTCVLLNYIKLFVTVRWIFPTQRWMFYMWDPRKPPAQSQALWRSWTQTSDANWRKSAAELPISGRGISHSCLQNYNGETAIVTSVLRDLFCRVYFK